MDDAAEVTQTIARRVRGLRTGRQLSLEQLSALSGVSRSAISLIERAESSPTAVVLDRLAAALGVAITALVEPEPAPGPVRRRAEQPVWVDPGTGYRRRNVSGPPTATAARQPALVEIEFPPGATVAFDEPVAGRRLEQLVWILAGAMAVTVGTTTHQLHRGDCLAFSVDAPVAFHNPTGRTARYAIVQSGLAG